MTRNCTLIESPAVTVSLPVPVIITSLAETMVETVNDPAYVVMRDQFLKDADQALRIKGKALDYYKIQFTQVNP